MAASVRPMGYYGGTFISITKLGAPMKFSVLASILLCSILPASLQAQHTWEESVQHFCKAHEVTDGPESDRVKAVHERLGPIVHKSPDHAIRLALVDSTEINAHTHFLTGNQSKICLPIGMVRFMGDSEGELAFVIASLSCSRRLLSSIEPSESV